MASSLQRRYRANGQTISRHGSDAGTTDSRTSGEHETYRQTREDDPKPTTELMSAIQLGIGQSIGGLASKANRDVLLQDFYTVQGVFFPREGSNLTPAHHHSDYRFKTYAPIAFRYFRELFGIQPDDFLLSLCNDPLNELSNPGASGSIFYITNDDEFIIKTVQHKEADFLQKLLPGYYMNLNQNPRTLLPKFYGLYCYQCGGKNIRFVIMNNLLPSSIKMHEKYDLKGSTYKRKASKHERSKKSPTLKDLDFIENHPDGIMLEGDTHMALIKTIERDCRVLQSFKIMDYSLLLGIHNLDQAAREREFEQLDASADLGSGTQGENQFGSLTRGRSVRQRLAQYSTAMEAIAARSEPLELDNEDIPPGGIPARNARGERLLLYIGVIDILQSYRLKKKLEHAMKAFVHDGDTISVHRPGFYGQRFQGFFAEKVFKKIPSLDQPQVKGPHMRFKKLVQLALKHSPSKRKGPGRQRSVTQQSENDKLTPAEKVTEVKAKSASDVAELGAVGGRPDLLPDSTPPPTFSEATGQRLSEAGRVLLTEGDHQRAVFHTRSNPEVITTSASFHSSTGAVSEADQAALPGSPAYSISESTPTHTECTEGTPSFTTSSPSCSSDMLVDSTTVSMRSLSKSQGSAAATAELPSDSTTENEIKRNSTVTVERTSSAVTTSASTVQQTSSRTSTTNVQSSVTHYPNPSQEADGQVAPTGEKHQLKQSVTTTTTTTNVEIAASDVANATGDSGAALASQGSPVEET